MSDITGYWNADGKAGIRAKTIILALNSFCSKTVNSITSIIKNAVGITHPFGRNETGINKIRLEKNLIGIPLNPNVYNVLVVGYDSSSTESYLRNLKSKTKKE
jgi:Altronate dehydratase